MEAFCLPPFIREGVWVKCPHREDLMYTIASGLLFLFHREGNPIEKGIL
jgi:hypothetical protein